MKNFIIYDTFGEIKRTGQCPDEDFALQALDGELILEGQADPMKDRVNVSTHAVMAGANVQPPKAEAYTTVRKRMYPTVEEQLDMLWHAMHQYHTPRVEPFYSTIKAVKQAVPKPPQSDDEIFDVGAI
jgi:hypothetical protein